MPWVLCPATCTVTTPSLRKVWSPCYLQSLHCWQTKLWSVAVHSFRPTTFLLVMPSSTCLVCKQESGRQCFVNWLTCPATIPLFKPWCRKLILKLFDSSTISVHLSTFGAPMLPAAHQQTSYPNTDHILHIQHPLLGFNPAHFENLKASFYIYGLNHSRGLIFIKAVHLWLKI